MFVSGPSGFDSGYGSDKDPARIDDVVIKPDSPSGWGSGWGGGFGGMSQSQWEEQIRRQQAMANIDAAFRRLKQEGANLELTKEGWSPLYNNAVSISLSTGAKAMDVSSRKFYNKDTRQWRGKNGKTYSFDWGGNGATRGKYKYAQRYSKILNKAGWGFTAGSIMFTEHKARTGQITNLERAAEHTGTGLSAIPGLGLIYGTVWDSFYWLGQNYGPSKWFRREEE